MTSNMNFDWFRDQWELLKEYATPTMTKQSQRFLEQEKNCTMVDGVVMVDALMRLRDEHKISGPHQKRERQFKAHRQVVDLTAEEIDEVLGVQDEEKGGIYTCSRCNSNTHTSYDTKQDRGGDEGMSTYVRCNKCNQQWRIKV
jgi:DNA-directed RNA polymerase subunit M/transcription elongation factor TFIIS